MHCKQQSTAQHKTQNTTLTHLHAYAADTQFYTYICIAQKYLCRKIWKLNDMLAPSPKCQYKQKIYFAYVTFKRNETTSAQFEKFRESVLILILWWWWWSLCLIRHVSLFILHQIHLDWLEIVFRMKIFIQTRKITEWRNCVEFQIQIWMIVQYLREWSRKCQMIWFRIEYDFNVCCFLSFSKIEI